MDELNPVVGARSQPQHLQLWQVLYPGYIYALGLKHQDPTVDTGSITPTYRAPVDSFVTSTFFPVMSITETWTGLQAITATQKRYLGVDDKLGVSYLYPSTYAAATGTDALTSPYLYAADLDNDGVDDLVYADKKGYVYYTVDLKNWARIGTNKFTMVVAGDFDEDSSEDDLAGINLNQYCVYINQQSDGTYPASWTKSGANKFSKIISMDLDGDTVKDDLVGINLNSYCVYTTVVTADWTKSGANKFSQVIDVDLGSSGSKSDLAGVNLNQYVVYTTVITADWTKSGANKFSSIITADLTGAGYDKDLAGVNLNQYCVYTTVITADWTKSGANKFSSIVSGDFDRDSTKDDMAGINLNQYIVYSDNATGSSGWTRHGTNKFASMVIADLDGDGYDCDLAAVNLNDHVLYALRKITPTATTEFDGWVQITKP